MGLYQTIAYSFGVTPLALAYASIIALISLSGLGKKLLLILAPVGKMALSNYIFQTLVGIFIFTRLGIAYGPMGPTAWTILAVSFLVCKS